uniref:(northern house mosquito) hypothetical protein n=1 Tax=Culex pipiens TaxID=7175 RepID=A0A8D8JLG4_CULPI
MLSQTPPVVARTTMKYPTWQRKDQHCVRLRLGNMPEVAAEDRKVVAAESRVSEGRREEVRRTRSSRIRHPRGRPVWTRFHSHSRLLHRKPRKVQGRTRANSTCCAIQF